MRKFTLICLFAFFNFTLIQAQDYNTSVGLRLGLSNGISLKHFMDEKTAIEGILSTRWKGFDITGLYEIHNTAFSVDGLKWYYGFGGHIGFWNGENVSWIDDATDITVIGVNGVLGLEFTFENAPINIGFDWKPTLNIFGASGLRADGGAVSIRYIF